MAVTNADLKWFKAQVNDDSSSNGGSISAEEIQDGAKNNLFPDVTQEELASGLVRYRKLFLKNTNASDTLENLVFYLEDTSPADDFFSTRLGTASDTQGDMTGPERWYGCGKTTQSYSAGATELSVELEAEEDLIQNGDTVVVINPDTGQIEFHDNVSVSRSGRVCTITLGEGLGFDLPAGAVVSAVISYGNLGPGQAAAVWLRETVPASAGGYLNNYFRLMARQRP